MMVISSTISPVLKFCLRFIGVWPDVQYSAARRLNYILTAMFVQYCQYSFILAHCKMTNMKNVVAGLPCSLYYSVTIIKMLMLWKYHRLVREILAIADTDWHECVNIDRHFHLMMTKASLSQFCSNALFCYNTVAGTLYYVSNNVIAAFYETQNDNSTSKTFPVHIVLPFEAEYSPVYELLVVFFFLHAMFNAYTFTVVDNLILSLVFHACGQLDIMCQELKLFSEEMPHYGSASHATGMLIEKHNKVITFSENLDKLFSFIALMQILCNSIVICFIGLFFMISDNETNGFSLVNTIIGYISVSVGIFIFCFVGEYLGNKSKSVGDAAYESLWYNMPSSHGKNVILVILRSQKQQTITVGGITNLSFEVFISIMKVSASYMSVLNAMY